MSTNGYGPRQREALAWRRPTQMAIAMVLAAVLAVGAAGCGGDDEGGDEGAAGGGEPVKLGAVVPASGPFAEWGRGNRVALNMLQEEVNANGGIDGRELQITITDDAADPAQSANLVRRLAGTDEVLAIAGPLTSSSAEVAFPIANSMEITSVSQASSKPGVAAENRPWAFRNTVDEAIFAEATVTEWKDQFDIRDAAIIYDSQDAVSEAIATAIFPEVLANHDIEALNGDDPVSFQTGDVDVSAQVTQLKSMNPDGVVIGADYSQAITVIREMESQGLTVPVIGGSPLISTAILNASDQIPIIAPATYYVGIDDPEAKEFTDNLTQALREAGEGNLEPTMYDANITEITQMFIEAIRENGLSGDLAQDRTMIREHLEQVEGFEGLLGPISFNDEGDAEKAFYVVRAEEGGSWRPEVVCQSSSPEDCEEASEEQ